MDKFLESGQNDLALQILMISKALEQDEALKTKSVLRKIWLNDGQKTFRSFDEFKMFLEEQKAISTLDLMVQNIKKEEKERKVS